MTTRTAIALPFLLAPLAGCNQKDPAADAANSPTPVVRLDFRNNPAYTQFFRFENPGDAQYVSAEAQGLRIALPQGATGAPVCVALRNGIQGDFEAVVTYELLHAEAGGADWGSGIQVLFRTATAGQDAVFVARQARGNGSQSTVFQRMTNRDGRRVSKQSKVVGVDPAAPAGTFRLVREGPLLTVEYGVGAAATLERLGQFDVGAEPIEVFRFGANPERGKNAVDIRLLNFALTAGQLTATPDAHHRPHTAIAIVATLLLAAGVIVWAVRRRRPSQVPGSQEKSPADSGANPARPD